MSLKTEDITTILGRGSEFEGKLQFEGTLRIEGSFAGEIHSSSVLVVAEGSKIAAEVDIGTIIVNGEVRGNIRATGGVELHSPARVYGTIETPSLQVDKGVIFEGTAKMENVGKKSAPVFPAPEGPKKVENGKKS